MILLYNPPSSPGRKPVLPMSLLSLAALLEGDIDYKILDGNLCGDTLAALTGHIRAGGIRILAATIMPGPQLTSALADCRTLKALFPDLIIVWGGYFPTLHPEAALSDTCVDYIFRGHAELPFAKFISALAHGKDPDPELPSLGYRSTTGIRTNPMAAIPDMRELPLYPWHRLPMERYLRRTFLGSRTLSHHTSYGCPFKCNFCAVVNMVNGHYTSEPPERTERAVRELVQVHRANAIEFHDNNFFVDENRIREVCDRIAPLGIRWWAYGRIDTLLKFSDSTFEKMRASGLAMVFMGAESGSPEMLKAMNKGGLLTPHKTLEIAERMARWGIVPEMSFVLGNPPDPQTDIDNTLGFVRKVKEANPDTEVILYMYSPVPLAGDLMDEASAKGFAFPETLDAWASADWEEFSQHRNATLPWMNQRHKTRIRNFQRVLHAAYPTVTDPRFFGARRQLLRLAGWWRYRLGFYHWPVELLLLEKWIHYQRPELSGF